MPLDWILVSARMTAGGGGCHTEYIISDSNAPCSSLSSLSWFSPLNLAHTYWIPAFAGMTDTDTGGLTPLTSLSCSGIYRYHDKMGQATLITTRPTQTHELSYKGGGALVEDWICERID